MYIIYCLLTKIYLLNCYSLHWLQRSTMNAGIASIIKYLQEVLHNQNKIFQILPR